MFEVDFTYDEPRWGTIEGIEEKSKEDAEEFALKQIDLLYPEAIDVEITEVREI